MRDNEALFQRGCLDIWIDAIVPCLKDSQSGELKDTVVFKIESRAYLKQFRVKNGWHINWNEIPKAIPHNSGAQIVQAEFSSDWSKTAGNTWCIAEDFWAI